MRQYEEEEEEGQNFGVLGVGYLRKTLAGTVLGPHPLVANVTFKSVYCVRPPSRGEGGAMVLATDLSKVCFEGEHLPVFILAVVCIVVCIVGFTVATMVAL